MSVWKSETTVRKFGPTVWKSETSVRKFGTTVRKSGTNVRKSGMTVRKFGTTVRRVRNDCPASPERLSGSLERLSGSSERLSGSSERVSRSLERLSGSLERLSGEAGGTSDKSNGRPNGSCRPSDAPARSVRAIGTTFPQSRTVVRQAADTMERPNLAGRGCCGHGRRPCGGCVGQDPGRALRGHGPEPSPRSVTWPQGPPTRRVEGASAPCRNRNDGNPMHARMIQKAQASMGHLLAGRHVLQCGQASIKTIQPTLHAPCSARRAGARNEVGLVWCGRHREVGIRGTDGMTEMPLNA